MNVPTSTASENPANVNNYNNDQKSNLRFIINDYSFYS